MHPQLNYLETKKSPGKIKGFSNKWILYTQEGDVLSKKNKTTFKYSQEEILRNYRNTEKLKKQRNAPIEKISEIIEMQNWDWECLRTSFILVQQLKPVIKNRI